MLFTGYCRHMCLVAFLKDYQRYTVCIFYLYLLRRSRKTLALGSSGSGTKKAGAEAVGEGASLSV
jgi:hypothetical protein